MQRCAYDYGVNRTQVDFSEQVAMSWSRGFWDSRCLCCQEVGCQCTAFSKASPEEFPPLAKTAGDVGDLFQ
jgi:hypothetical protein